MEIFENSNEEVIRDPGTSRFNGAGWFDTARNKSIIMIGCGGTGSFSALTLARFSPKSIDLYDQDIVEEHNMSGQFFTYSQVGMNKVDAVASNIMKFTGYQNIVNLHKKRFTKIDTDLVNTIVVMAMDEPDLRKSIAKDAVYVCNSLGSKSFIGSWIIDCRLSFDTLQIYTFPMNAMTSLRSNTLYPGLYDLYFNKIAFSKDESDGTICSLKQTTFMANMIGSFVANCFESICALESEEMQPLPPFFIEYNFRTFLLRCINYEDYRNDRR